MLRLPRPSRGTVLTHLCALAIGVSLLAVSPSAEAQSARIAGVVLVDSLERPIAGADIELIGTAFRARSDSSGAFAIRGIPVGEYRLQVRAVGYAPLAFDIRLTSDGVDGLEALLKPMTQELERVNVRATSTPTSRHLAGFESRRQVGIGRFLDSTTLWKSGDHRQWAQAIVAQAPGLRIMHYGSSGALAFGSRGPTRSAPRGDVTDKARGARQACYTRIYVDGMIRYNVGIDEQLFDVSNFDGPPIIAAEVYTPAQLPVEFNRIGSASCGAILLWTRR
ncbi:MAG: carboxypeptidase-like regulatory domain-containing protein [Gemmatimonadaceae bacterium]|nr:carboxypeptidase-like regulatory domain-containing protein [Gemmatimonadaceae bacterium]